ncbi:MAG: acetyl-CoA carboxylase biotin carboxyl carrier protein subunit [Chloroflexota bacterium]|nr:MAG: acetyl-CoA carboxylase biotin carboxyl carrier protein subunit [Chloroflexota bacterium]
MDSPHHFTLLAGGEMLEVYVEEIGDRYVIYLAGNVFEVAAAPQLVGRKDPTRSALPVNGSAAVNAPMPGLVLQVFVEPGQQVERGDVLLVLEAMKMENDIRAPAAGRVDHVGVRAGQRVDQGQRLVVID